jgi:hypothetical protein
MESGGKVQGKSQANGVREFLGQGERRVALLEGLSRIAKIPQSQGPKGEANHPRVQSIAEGLSAVLLGVIEGNTLLHVLLSQGHLSKMEQGWPQCPMSC